MQASTPQVKSKDGNKVYIGAEALKVKFEFLEEKKGKGGKITLDDLQPFHMYQQFTSKAVMDLVNQWTAEIISGNAMVAMVSESKAASSSHGPKPAKKGKTSHGHDTGSQKTASQVYCFFA
jgi:hypothetical protein